MPAEYLKWMSRLGQKFMPAMMAGVLEGALECIPLMVQRTEMAIPASDYGVVGAMGQSGHYRMGWRAERITQGARIYNLRPYAGVIEYGRRPAFVSKEGRKNIKAWGMRKFGMREKDAERMAWALARKMAPPPMGAGRSLRARSVMTGVLPQMSLMIRASIQRTFTRFVGGGR